MPPQRASSAGPSWPLAWPRRSTRSLCFPSLAFMAFQGKVRSRSHEAGSNGRGPRGDKQGLGKVCWSKTCDAMQWANLHVERRVGEVG